MKTLLLLIISFSISFAAIASETPGTAQISGLVKDIDSIPISGVRVELFLRGNVNSIKTKFTDIGGHYAFDGLAPGSYGLGFTKENLVTIYTETRKEKDKAKHLIIQPYETVTYPDAVMHAGGAVTGRISGLNGYVPGSPVQLYTSGGDGRVYQVSSDSEGNYSFTSIPTGKYALRVVLADKSSVWYGGEESYEISVTAPDTTSGIDMSLAN